MKPAKDSTSTKKRKVNWYQKGRKDALMYWRKMDAGDSAEDIFGYLGVLVGHAQTEAGETTGTIEFYDDNAYIHGFAEVMQERIENLMERASLFDNIAKTVRDAVLAAQPAATAH
ncbi:MAG: hypothetical protein AABZ67_16595 [Pseudomonadota bacterium]